MTPTKSEAPVRRRRSTDEVRQRIVESASVLFATQGYEATSTRQIAREAGVVEPLVYRHYGSKAGLLEAVVVEPLTEFIEQFAKRWLAAAKRGKLEPRVRDYVSQLYDVLTRNRDVLVNLLTVADPAGREAWLATPLDRLFETMAAMPKPIETGPKTT